MRCDEIRQDKPTVTFSHEEIVTLWPQSRAELLGFALHLYRTGRSITANQIELAVQMADLWFETQKKDS